MRKNMERCIDRFKEKILELDRLSDSKFSSCIWSLNLLEKGIDWDEKYSTSKEGGIDLS